MSGVLEIVAYIFIIGIGILWIMQKVGFIHFVTEAYKHRTQSKDNLEAIESKKELFERKYYKDVAISHIVDLLKEWASVLYDMENCFLVKPKRKIPKHLKLQNILNEQIIEMHLKLLLYCTSRTLSLFSIIMQDFYTGEYPLESEENHELLFAVALLISNIKYDYSSDFIDPLDILKIKITDIYKYEDCFNQLREKYYRYILS